MRKVWATGFALVHILPFLSIPFFLLVFSLSPSVSKNHHQNLLSSAFELIFVTKSGRDVVFLVFNFILVTIFLGCPKPSDVDDVDWLFTITTPSSFEKDYEAKQEETDEDYDGNDHNDGDNNERGYDGCSDNNNYGDIDTEKDDKDSEGEEDGEDEEDSDLERRIEEFIAMVNRKWREELLNERLLCKAVVA